jgi:glutathionyl-hydroquinone reductase
MSSDHQYIKIIDRPWADKILIDTKYSPNQRRNIINILDRLYRTEVGKNLLNLQPNQLRLTFDGENSVRMQYLGESVYTGGYIFDGNVSVNTIVALLHEF